MNTSPIHRKDKDKENIHLSVCFSKLVTRDTAKRKDGDILSAPIDPQAKDILL